MSPDLALEKEDSSDLTDGEIASAVPCENVAAVVAYLNQRPRVCDSCGKISLKYRYEVRRRSPHIYWRLTSECVDQHKNATILRADWLKDETS